MKINNNNNKNIWKPFLYGFCVNFTLFFRKFSVVEKYPQPSSIHMFCDFVMNLSKSLGCVECIAVLSCCCRSTEFSFNFLSFLFFLLLCSRKLEKINLEWLERSTKRTKNNRKYVVPIEQPLSVRIFFFLVEKRKI